MLARAVALAVSVVDGCYSSSGTAGLFESNPLQRRLRDGKALSQHAIFTTNTFRPVGQMLFGEPLGPLLF